MEVLFMHYKELPFVPITKELLDLGLEVAKAGLLFEDTPLYETVLNAYAKVSDDALAKIGIKTDQVIQTPWLLNDYYGYITTVDQELLMKGAIIALDPHADVPLLHITSLILFDEVARETVWLLGCKRLTKHGQVIDEKIAGEYVAMRLDGKITHEDALHRTKAMLQLFVELGLLKKVDGGGYVHKIMNIEHIPSAVLFLEALEKTYFTPYSKEVLIPSFVKFTMKKEYIRDYLCSWTLSVFAEQLGLNGDI